MSMLSRFAATGGGGDPYWANVSYLLVGNGANGTTTNIVDSSSNHLSTTVNGNTVISTTQSKFGSGSVYFDGSGDYLSISSTTVLQLSSSDFTLEFWYYPSTSKQYANILGKSDSSVSGFSIQMYRNTLNKPAFVATSNASAWDKVIESSQAVTLGTWNYLAVVRNGSAIVMYLNGQNVGSITSSTTILDNSIPVSIGAYSDGSYAFNGYIYDLRITKGVARYSGSTMTVPTAPLPIG